MFRVDIKNMTFEQWVKWGEEISMWISKRKAEETEEYSWSSEGSTKGSLCLELSELKKETIDNVGAKRFGAIFSCRKMIYLLTSGKVDYR